MEVNEQTAIDHGLSKDEFRKINDLLKRKPNLTELAIFSAMWNEHCSYKSSRKHLKNLHTEGSQVIQGPGENAGVVDIGDDEAIVFKIESHNHPSFLEPYQGAATGVGGIMRDVFTMGARPIANLNSIHFGSTQNKKTKNCVENRNGYNKHMCFSTKSKKLEQGEGTKKRYNEKVKAVDCGLKKAWPFGTRRPWKNYPLWHGFR